MTNGPSAFRIALVYPDLLGTYGDSGNATLLAQRLRWRGRPAEVLTIEAGAPVPEGCDLYVVGGGEDLPQALASRRLGRPGPLHRAVEGGAAVLAICAGLQILGTSFIGPDGVETDGLGLVDCHTVRRRGRRAVGELVVEPHQSAEQAGPALPTLSGYENHGGRTILGRGVEPAGRVLIGEGNGEGEEGHPATDGFRVGRIWGTYLHGPVLARNPALADLLLGWVAGPLAPLDDAEADALRAERLAAAAAERSRRRLHLGRPRRIPARRPV